MSHSVLFHNAQYNIIWLLGLSNLTHIVVIVPYTGERVCDVALIRCTLGSGNPRRVGILVGWVQGSNGGQRGLVYEQPGTEVDQGKLEGSQTDERNNRQAWQSC